MAIPTVVPTVIPTIIPTVAIPTVGDHLNAIVARLSQGDFRRDRIGQINRGLKRSIKRSSVGLARKSQGHDSGDRQSEKG
jgi:hypothetical protein